MTSSTKTTIGAERGLGHSLKLDLAMTLETVTQYLQVAALLVTAIYNGLLTYESYENGHRWKTIFSALTVALLVALTLHLTWPIF
jgi:hypothetical protein